MPPPPPPEAPGPTLPDDLLEEIFLRIPTDEPASLVRASLANKHWLGLLTGPRFRGRYRELHGSPPVLGFVYSCGWPSLQDQQDPVPRFISTTNFGASIPHDKDSEYSVWDCRHGRVLLCDTSSSPPRFLFVVWDPKKGCRMALGPQEDFLSLRAAVLCAAPGCDHGACHEGSFRVVLVSLENDGTCRVLNRVSSPKMGEWSKHYSDRHRSNSGCELWSEKFYHLDLAANAYIDTLPPVHVEDALYFILFYQVDNHVDVGVLKYDLGSECLSTMDGPLADTDIASDVILIAMADGSLGFAHVNGLTLNLSSRQMGSDQVSSWTRRIVINLKELLPIQNPEKRLALIGSVESCDIIFVTTDLGIYQINLKSLQWKKICEREEYRVLFPYMGF